MRPAVHFYFRFTSAFTCDLIIKLLFVGSRYVTHRWSSRGGFKSEHSIHWHFSFKCSVFYSCKRRVIYKKKNSLHSCFGRVLLDLTEFFCRCPEASHQPIAVVHRRRLLARFFFLPRRIFQWKKKSERKKHSESHKSWSLLLSLPHFLYVFPPFFGGQKGREARPELEAFYFRYVTVWFVDRGLKIGATTRPDTKVERKRKKKKKKTRTRTEWGRGKG